MLDDRGYSGHLIRGQPPGALLDPTLRHMITKDIYWKEQCFALNEATLLDRAVEVSWVGGTYGNRVSPFLCLAFKMLQLGVDAEVLLFYLREGGEEFKYLRALAAFYVRLTSARDEEVYERLEPYLGDWRKLRTRGGSGWGLTTMDAFVDSLMEDKQACSVDLWMLVGRERLEDEDRLGEREVPEEIQKLLDDEDEEEDEEEGEKEEEEGEKEEKEEEEGEAEGDGEKGGDTDEEAGLGNAKESGAHEEGHGEAQSADQG